MRLESAIERIIDRCNLEGDGCDVYKIMYQYKSVRTLSDEEQDRIYDHVVKVLGF